MLWESWPGVAAAEGTLAEALKENWGDAAVRRIVASAPEVRCYDYYRLMREFDD